MAARGWIALGCFLVTAVVSGGCTGTCADSDRQCAHRAMQSHPARKLETWKQVLSLPLEARIRPAPAHVVEYLNLDNIANGYPEKPRAADLDAAMMADFRSAIDDLPVRIRTLVRDRLAGLYFVEDLGGTGYGEAVLAPSGNPVAAWLVFDARILARLKANEWATWKERTPFTADPSYALEARIEPDAHDNRKNAIQYILLHELGHVASVGTDVHPPWYLQPKDVSAGRYPFFDLSWKINRDSNQYESLFDADFPQRSRVVYYKAAKLAAADMVSVYANLKHTNFASLYAATTPGDDFAEAFASYVHVVLMKRPWEIRIRQGDRVVHTFGPCWEEPRCAAKRKILEDLLKRPAG